MATNVKSAFNPTGPDGRGYLDDASKEGGRLAGHSISGAGGNLGERQTATRDEIDAALDDILSRRADLLRRLADA